MTTKDILNQMEKEFESRFSTYRFLSKPTLSEMIVNDGTQIDERKPEEIVKSFIHSYTRTLLESFGEEIIGEDENIRFLSKISTERSRAKNQLRDEQRLKVKEILEVIK